MTYIDEQKAKRKIRYIFKTYGVSAVIGDKINKAISDSTIDIVRCEKCEHNPNIKTLTKGMVWCRKFRNEVHPNDFCSYGRMKGGAE